MEIKILMQQLDDTIICTSTSGNSGCALPETRRMRIVPRPWACPWNPPCRSHGYAREAAPDRQGRLEQQAFQDEENQNGRDGSGLSEESMDECLMGSLGCARTGEEICTICQDEIHLEEKMTALSCSHGYHLRCIRKWLKIKNECAVCRAPFNGEGRR